MIRLPTRLNIPKQGINLPTKCPASKESGPAVWEVDGRYCAIERLWELQVESGL